MLARSNNVLRPVASLRPSAMVFARAGAPALVEQRRNMGVVRTNIDNKTRPVSPHVTIYAFPVSAISSVTHRFTGLGLTIWVYGMGMAALAGADTTALMQTIGTTAVVGPLCKFGVAGGTLFHTLSGMRHLYWEA